MDGFEIIELDASASPEQIQGLVDITFKANADEPTFNLRLAGLDDHAKDEYVRKSHVLGKIESKDNKIFAVRDILNDKLIGATALQLPTSDNPAKDWPTSGAGVNKDYFTDAGKRFVESAEHVVFGCTVIKEGYDSTRDCHKRGTQVLPEYQRRGMGSWLTRHCNTVADQLGASTLVVARPQAWGMLRSTGFEVLQYGDFDVSEFGDDRKMKWAAMRRIPMAD